MPLLWNPPFSTLLSSDNIWTGTNTYDDDVTFNEEIKGSKQSFVFTFNAAFSFLCFFT
ncbi:MAG: hypothetical protein IH819_05225 [Bacteroidetes bacterium]|nr:hypothetical protein [Bacteroidota bacterium]